jgi:hypothetical protein
MRATIGTIAAALLCAAGAAGDGKAPAPKPLTRLFVQDFKTSSLKWADVTIGADQKLALGALADVPGFKKLDPTRQKLVQMRESDGVVCVGVRDDAEGALESGWVLIRSNVGYKDHGDHGHWRYKKEPEVADSRLDTKQGNPAHLYLYRGRFFLANDRLNGYTRLDPAKWASNDGTALGKGEPQFLVGGGNHITLAVVDDAVGYSCWIDGGGPNKGRVDVTPVTGKARSEPAYSFALPTGGTHGATACAGKVFFAPAEGVCWVDADAGLKLKGEQVRVRHIDLGKEGDKARRTGAFVTHGNHVLFVTGKERASLVVLDAKAAEPKAQYVQLAGAKGTHAVTPEVVVAPNGRPYALVFHDRATDSDAEELLEVVALDPNGDGNLSDAKSLKTVKVGASAVDGHYGHHDIAFDADRRFGFFTNPGDGTVSVLSMKSLEVVATFKVGGTPTALVARGGEDHDD